MCPSRSIHRESARRGYTRYPRIVRNYQKKPRVLHKWEASNPSVTGSFDSLASNESAIVTGELPPTFSSWPTDQRIEYLWMAKDRDTLLEWALAAASREQERGRDRVNNSRGGTHHHHRAALEVRG